MRSTPPPLLPPLGGLLSLRRCRRPTRPRSRATPSQHVIDRTAVPHMDPGAPRVVHQARVRAARLFEGIGQEGEAVGIEPALGYLTPAGFERQGRADRRAPSVIQEERPRRVPL